MESRLSRIQGNKGSLFSLLIIVLLLSSMSPRGFVKCQDDGGNNTTYGNSSNNNSSSINNHTSSDLDLDLNNLPPENPSTSEFLTQIYQHCLKHKRCSHTYGLDSGIVNRTLFDYLAERVITKYESYLFPLITMSALESRAQILEYIWPLILVTEAQENIPLCPLDHELRVRLDGTVECALSPSTRSLSSRATGCVSGGDVGDDSQAGVSDTTLALLYVLIAAAVIILIILFYKSFPSFLDLRTNGPLAKYRVPEFIEREIRYNKSGGIGAHLLLTEGKGTETKVYIKDEYIKTGGGVIITSDNVNGSNVNANNSNNNNNTKRRKGNEKKDDNNGHEDTERIIISSKKGGRRLLR